MTDERQTPAEPRDPLASVREKAARARRTGSLQPLTTHVENVSEQDLAFVVRVIDRTAGPRPGAGDDVGASAGEDPFRPPYEPDLYVGEITPTHVGLLNKYPVLDDHLLLVTRSYEAQTAPLTHSDCAALLTALAACDGLVFYNGGATAGASQGHRHLQLVPLPLGPPPAEALPLAPWLAAAEPADSVRRSPRLPFVHAISAMDPAWLTDPARAAGALLAASHRLWQACGFGEDAPDFVPFNLLATRRWLWLVPRRHASAHGLGVNALGYAGALLAPDAAGLRWLRQNGPLRLLADVAYPVGRNP